MDKKNKELTNEIPVETTSIKLKDEKAQIKLENEIAARARRDSYQNQDLTTDELKTRLTEEEIATTTQIDQFNNTNEIRNYIKTNVNNPAPKKKRKFWPFGKK